MTLTTKFHIEVLLDTGKSFDLGIFDTEERADERLQNYANSLTDSGVEFIGGNGVMVSTKHIVYMCVVPDFHIDPVEVQKMFMEESQ